MIASIFSFVCPQLPIRPLSIEHCVLVAKVSLHLSLQMWKCTFTLSAGRWLTFLTAAILLIYFVVSPSPQFILPLLASLHLALYQRPHFHFSFVQNFTQMHFVLSWHVNLLLPGDRAHSLDITVDWRHILKCVQCNLWLINNRQWPASSAITGLLALVSARLAFHFILKCSSVQTLTQYSRSIVFPVKCVSSERPFATIIGYW